jgi:hypothetical protein
MGVRKRKWKTARGEAREAWIADWYEGKSRRIKTFRRECEAREFTLSLGQRQVPSAISDSGAIDATHLLEQYCGIYFLCFNGEVVYVGQTQTLAIRARDHRRQGIKNFDSVFFIRTHREDLDETEAYWALLLTPKYNTPRTLKAMRTIQSRRKKAA